MTEQTTEPKTPRKTRTVLSASDKRKMRSLYRTGEYAQNALADHFGVVMSTASRTLKGVRMRKGVKPTAPSVPKWIKQERQASALNVETRKAGGNPDAVDWKKLALRYAGILIENGLL